MYLAAIINIVSLYGMVSELGAVCVMETHFLPPPPSPFHAKLNYLKTLSHLDICVLYGRPFDRDGETRMSGATAFEKVRTCRDTDSQTSGWNVRERYSNILTDTHTAMF